MKKIIITSIALIIWMSSFPQQTDIIFAEVDGNYATIYNMAAYRNCCAGHEMYVSKDDHDITWFQDVFNEICYCMCYFDLSVTIGPLDAGTYHVDVYRSWYYGDSLYLGSTDFEIALPSGPGNMGIINSSQSDCYEYTDIPDAFSPGIQINCHPNPAKTQLTFECTVQQSAEISVLNLLGQKVKHFRLKQAGDYEINWGLKDKNGMRLKSGIYFYVLETGEEKLKGKVIIE